MAQAIESTEKLTREQAAKILMFELEKGEKSKKWYTIDQVWEHMGIKYEDPDK